MEFVRYILLAAVFVGIAMSAGGHGPPGELASVLVTINPVSEPPELDGDLDDEAWRAGSWVWEFWTTTGDFPGSQRTESCLVHSATELFVAFRCYEQWMNEVVATPRERDSRVWEDDSVEVFIDRNLDGSTYYHFITNTLGIQFDEIVNDVRWDSTWRVATGRTETFWTVEMAVPFSDLGGPPAAGEVWGLNLNRERKPREEFYSWSFTGPTFHAPKRFGRAVFLAETVDMEVVDVGDLFLGRGEARLTVSSSEESAWVATTVTHGEKDLHTHEVVIRSATPGEEQTFRVPYQVTESGEGFVELYVVHATTGDPRLQRIYPYAVPEAEDRLREAELFQIRAESAASTLVSGSPAHRVARDLLGQFAQRLEALREGFAQPEKLGRKGWEEQENRCENLIRDYRLLMLQVVASVAFTEGRDLPPYAVTVANSLQKIFPDIVPEPAVSRGAAVSLARGEHEAVQLVLVPFTQALEGVGVSIGSLQPTNEGSGEGVPQVNLFEVGLVETKEPAYAVERVGEWPDPLIPLDQVTVPVGKARSVWVDVYAPESVSAGGYRGTITVQPGNAPPVELDLRVNVWDFALPLRSSLTTAFAFSESAIRSYYGMEEVQAELRQKYYTFLLDHRLNPTDLYHPDLRPRREDLPFCLERGLAAFNVGHIRKEENWGDGEIEAYKQKLADVYSFLKAENLVQSAYVYAFDEPEPKDYEALRKVLAAVAEVAPDLRRVTTEPPTVALAGSVDVWVPNLEDFQPDAARARQEGGEEVWWYVASRPIHPYPNFFIDYAAIHHRIVPWLNWRYGSTGLLYYSLNWGWMANLRGERRWPEVEWNTQTYNHYNGDGQLIYPGPNGEPWSSIRLELIRDGIEDYEYFSILRERVERGGDSPAAQKAAGLLDPLGEVVKSLTEYTRQPKVLLDYRARIAEAIEQLNGS